MPRTKQNNPKNLKDKIEEAQKELKDPKGPQKDAPESGRRNVDKSQSLKRKKVVAGNQLKKIPKSPVKKPLQSKPSDPAVLETPSDKTPTLCSTSSASNSPSRNPTSPTRGQQDAQDVRTTPESPKQGLPNQERIKEEEKPPSSEPPQAAEISETQSPKREDEPFQSSAPLDVLLKAMEPDFSTLSERKNPPVGKVGSQASVGEVQAVPTLNVGIHPAPLQTYYIDKQGNFIGIAAPIQGTVQASTQSLQNTPHFVPVANQEKARLQMSFGAGPVAITHAPVPTGPSALPQSQPPIVQTCQSLSASVPSSIQVPVTPGGNQVQMTTVMNFGGEQISKDQKMKKPGKYVCEYCNRACAKPSVLLKHIRSHTGERPYPCVTCGFSFKTKSNLYKHKKSHAHAIKLGLMARSESGGGSMSQESEKGVGTHSEAEESGESDEEGSNAEDSPQSIALAISESLAQVCQGEVEQSNVPESCKAAAGQRSHEPKVTAALPKVVVYPVNVSPLRADSPRVTMAAPEQAAARQREFQSASLRSSITVLSSLKEVDGTSASLDVSEDEDQQCKSPLMGGHAQLQRQQATDFSQQQQPKCLLSPRSLGSTDSGYFSRSESADQAMSPPSPFVKITPPVEMEKNVLPSLPPVVAAVMHVQSEPKARPAMEGQMRPPLEPKALSLEERISKLISDNEAVVDNKQLDSVKPRRTSLSRRGSIDSPKSYIFKDSFQFDLKPIGRSSSSSDIPKSPFTPTDKSKQVFLLSVPSQYPPMDCLPITRSNSMPTTPGHSALPVNVPPLPHPLRICQSFDEKMGPLNDDVFSSAPTTPNPAMHARTLVRQVAVEDFSTSHEGHGLPTVRSMDEGYPGPASNMTELMQRSRSFEDKNRKPSQNKGTMYECETCRNRYRKLENFETHKKFYCSELHGPKKKDVEQEVFHVHMQQPFVRRAVSGTGIDQQTSFRKRRMKMKSVGDEDDQSPTDTVPPCSVSLDSGQLPAAMTNRSFPPHAVMVDIQPKNSQNKLPQIQLVARGTSDARLSPIRETKMANKGELQRQGSGTSVIRHTNSLSRPNSFETESMDRASPVESMDKDPANKPKADQVANISIDASHESKSQSVDFGKQRVAQFGERESCEIPTTPVHQSRLVRQNNIQVPEILVTEEPDREAESQSVDLTEKQADQFSWPQRSESLSKLPAEKLPPKKKRIRLAQMDQSSGESSLESSLSRSLSRDSSLSRGSSISASFDREESLRSESPSRAECANKSADLQGLPAAFNTLNVPGVMRRAASEQITCTQPSVEISSDYRSKSFDCGNVSPSRSLSPAGLPKSAGQISQVPLIERRRGPLVRQMSLKIGPESQQPVRKSVAPLDKVANVYSLTQTKPQQIHIASRNAATQPFVLHSGEQPLQHNEQLVQSINLGSPTLQQQVHGLPHPWHQTSRVQVCQKTQQPANQILVCRENLPNKPEELKDKSDFVPKYQLPCASLRSSQTFTFSNPPGAQIALPVLTIPIANPILGVSKSSEAEGQTHTSLPQILITHEQIHPVPKSSNKNVLTQCKEHVAKRDHSPIRPATSLNLSNVELASSIGPIQCTQKLASVTLCPQQEPTASSKRMLSPANSLDIYMEKHQKRAKDEHGVACLTDGRSVNYLNSKMSEVTRQRKLMLVRQSCTTEPADSPIETEAPPLSPPKADVEKEGEDEVKPMSPDSTGLEKETCTIIPEESCPVTSTSQSIPVSKVQDKIEEQKWPLAKSPIRPSSFHCGQAKLTTSVSVVNTKDSHRLSFPSLKTTTTLTWCFLMKRKSLHAQQTDLKTSAYAAWAVSPNNPNPLGLPTKVVMSLFDSKQSSKKILYTSAIKTSGAKDLLSYSGKLKDVMPKVPLIQKSKSVESRSKAQPELQSSLESDKEQTTKSEPRRVKIFDGGFKSNEEYVYVRGRGRGKYICEECGIRCKKPSMLRKHIRTHSDVRPYHCTHCNFSFKTKGNLTKHMKSKAHSKKCLEMGVPDGLIDDQEAEDSGDHSHVGSADRPDSDDSDAPDDEDDPEEEEDDSQAESGLSTNPSVCASPQHFPGRDSDAPPSALLAQMSISSVLPLTADSDSVAMLSPKLLTVRDDALKSLPSATAAAPPGGAVGEVSDTESVHMMSPVSPCRQMSIDFPDFEVPPSPPAPVSKTAKSTQDASPAPPTAPSAELSFPVDRGTQTSCFPAHTPLLFHTNPPTAPPAGPPGLFPSSGPGEAHLFSHLPLHSQQPPRSSYSMLPVGGIQLVPAAGLTAYSAFVPIQAGQVQLTIPAVGVIHRNTSPLPAPSASPRDGEGIQPLLLQDPGGGAFPCFAQTLQPLNLETLNIMGIANAGLASTQLLPQQGLTLNATLGLQVLAANPAAQSSTGTHHVPGLQILNIALPAIIPSVSPMSALSPLPGGAETQAERGQSPAKMSPAPAAASSPPRTNASPANASAEARPPQVDKREASAYTEPKRSPLPEGQTAKPAKTWQKSTEDYDNEASSDDEDRLVIAT